MTAFIGWITSDEAVTAGLLAMGLTGFAGLAWYAALPIMERVRIARAVQAGLGAPPWPPVTR